MAIQLCLPMEIFPLFPLHPLVVVELSILVVCIVKYYKFKNFPFSSSFVFVPCRSKNIVVSSLTMGRLKTSFLRNKRFAATNRMLIWQLNKINHQFRRSPVFAEKREKIPIPDFQTCFMLEKTRRSCCCPFVLHKSIKIIGKYVPLFPAPFPGKRGDHFDNYLENFFQLNVQFQSFWKLFFDYFPWTHMACIQYACMFWSDRNTCFVSVSNSLIMPNGWA